MSNYSSFFAQDFAARCADLLKHFYCRAKAKDRDVTLLLAIAAAGLVVPLERLSESSAQPPLDRPSFEAEASELRALLGKTLADSEMVDVTPGVWGGGLLKSAAGDPDGWEELRVEEVLPPTTTVSDLIYWLRHALAHGNITTRPQGIGRTIERIVFVCGYPESHKRSKKQPLRYVAVAPDDLKCLLDNWFSLLSELGVSREVVAAALDSRQAA